MATDILSHFSSRDNEPEDLRPLPLIIADQYQFPLASIDDSGEMYYSVQDWIVGIASTTSRKAGEIWRQIEIDETRISVTPLPYVASDGKTYQRDYTTAEGLYFVAQHLRSTANRPLLPKIKHYLALSGVFADEARTNPDVAIQKIEDSKDFRARLRDGFTPEQAEEWVAKRHEGKAVRDNITDEWKARGVKGQEYARLTDDVNGVALGSPAWKVKQQLALGKNDKLRDHLSAGEIATITATEFFSKGLHAKRDSQGVDELSDDVKDTRPIINAARDAIKAAFSKERPRK
jgi:hypothetical protein